MQDLRQKLLDFLVYQEIEMIDEWGVEEFLTELLLNGNAPIKFCRSDITTGLNDLSTDELEQLYNDYTHGEDWADIYSGGWDGEWEHPSELELGIGEFSDEG